MKSGNLTVRRELVNVARIGLREGSYVIAESGVPTTWMAVKKQTAIHGNPR